MVVHLMLFVLLVTTFTFLILRLFVAGYNYFTSPTLQQVAYQESSFVSILIPVRDEENNIKRLLDSILKQQGISFEVIILDDHSVDGTRAIAEEYASEYANIKVLCGKTLPDGWTGKNFACFQLAQAARGKYLVFLDADVELHPDLVRSAVYQMRLKGLSLLSLFCRQEVRTFGEKVTVPLMNFLLLTLLPIRLIESHKDPIFSAACGQFMMFTSETYHKYQWHERASAKIAEDLAIMKMIKQNAVKGQGLLSGKLMTCRMYTGFIDAVEGFSKNFITPFNDSIALFVLFLSVVLFGPLLVIGTGDLYLILGLLSIISLTRFFTGKLSGEPNWKILLHPFQMLSLFYIGLVSVYRRCTKSVSWKGRVIPMVTENVLG